MFVAACGLDADPDPLSEEVVNDLSEEIGTATGERYSGFYSTVITPTGCDCPTVDAGEEFGDVDVCDFVGDIDEGDLQVLHTAGFLKVDDATGISYTGAIQLDGSFSVGSVTNVSEAIFEGKTIGRIDGVFGSSAEAGFEAELAQRAIIDSAVLETPVDCRATFDVVAEYTGP